MASTLHTASAREPRAPIRSFIRGMRPLEIRDEDRDHIRRKIPVKLKNFASAIERVSVRLEDANGPRGGVDKVCRVKVVLRSHPSVVVEARHTLLRGAVDNALTAAQRAVRRTVQRHRAKELTTQTM